MPNITSGLAPILFGFFAVIFLLKVLVFFLEKRAKTPSYITYRSHPSLLSPPELAAFETLRNLLPQSLHICAKPRIADVLVVEKGNRQSGFNRISQKHVDFLIIETATGIPRLAIEIDDRSHLLPHRQARDEFVDRSFAQAGIPIAHFWAGQPIAIEDIKKHFPAKSA